MDIQWHGRSCFSLKGKNGTVVTDPFEEKMKLDADVVLANSDFEHHHAVKQFGKDVIIFDWPGEYEARSIIIQGISAYDRPREKEDGKKDDANRVIIFTLLIDGFRVCHLSNVGHRLTTETLEAIGDVDILLIPVGGSGCLDVKKAHEVIEQLEPRIVIPMYYDSSEAFMKEMGLHGLSKEKTLKFSAPSALPQEQTEFRLLEQVV